MEEVVGNRRIQVGDILRYEQNYWYIAYVNYDIDDCDMHELSLSSGEWCMCGNSCSEAEKVMRNGGLVTGEEAEVITRLHDESKTLMKKRDKQMDMIETVIMSLPATRAALFSSLKNGDAFFYNGTYIIALNVGPRYTFLSELKYGFWDDTIVDSRRVEDGYSHNGYIYPLPLPISKQLNQMRQEYKDYVKRVLQELYWLEKKNTKS